MDLLEFKCKGKTHTATVELENIHVGKITREYYVRFENFIYIFKQYYSHWELLKGDLDIELYDTLIDALIYKYERNLIALCTYNGQKQMIRISNFPNIGQKYAYHVMVNNIGTAVLIYTENDGWNYNIRPNEWFGIADIDAIIDLLESNSIPWVTQIEKDYLLQ